MCIYNYTIYICAHIYISIYIYVHICMCIYQHLQEHRNFYANLKKIHFWDFSTQVRVFLCQSGLFCASPGFLCLEIFSGFWGWTTLPLCNKLQIPPHESQARALDRSMENLNSIASGLWFKSFFGFCFNSPCRPASISARGKWGTNLESGAL